MGSWMWDEDEEEPMMLDKAGANRRERQMIERTMLPKRFSRGTADRPSEWPDAPCIWFDVTRSADMGETGTNDRSSQVLIVGQRLELRHTCQDDGGRHDIVFGLLSSIASNGQAVTIKTGETHDGEACDCIDAMLTLALGDTLELTHHCGLAGIDEKLSATVREIHFPDREPEHAKVEVKRA